MSPLGRASVLYEFLFFFFFIFILSSLLYMRGDTGGIGGEASRWRGAFSLRNDVLLHGPLWTRHFLCVLV